MSSVTLHRTRKNNLCKYKKFFLKYRDFRI